MKNLLILIALLFPCLAAADPIWNAMDNMTVANHYADAMCSSPQAATPATDAYLKCIKAKHAVEVAQEAYGNALRQKRIDDSLAPAPEASTLRKQEVRTMQDYMRAHP